MSKYDAQAAQALSAIKRKGALVRFRRDADQIDPVTQQISSAPITYDAYVLAIPLAAGKARYLFGEGADITKPRLSLSIALKGVGNLPQDGDRFTWSGVSYVILSVELLDPAGEGAIFASGYAEAA